MTKIKNEAESPAWEDLYRNISEFEGEPVTFTGRIQEVVESDDSRHVYLIVISGGLGSDTKAIWGDWNGDPFRRGDEIRFWGTVEGLHEYQSFAGKQSVPKIDIAAMELQSEISTTTKTKTSDSNRSIGM